MTDTNGMHRLALSERQFDNETTFVYSRWLEN